MMIIRQPLYIYPGDRLDSELDRLRQIFSATAIKSSEPGPPFNHVFLLGPRTAKTTSQLLKYWSLTLNQSSDSTPMIAWGVWMPPQDNPLHAPLVQVYRPLRQSGDRPLLISEQPLQPGELIIVTEHCDSLVMLSPSEVTQTLPDHLQWFVWHSDISMKNFRPIYGQPYPQIFQPQTPVNTINNPGPILRNSPPWLRDCYPEITFPLTPKTPSFQLISLLTSEELAALTLALNDAPWTRQIREASSHDICNLVPWSQSRTCPSVVKQMVWQLQNPNLKRKVAELTGIPVISRRELIGSRLRPGDRLFPGQNPPRDGKLRVQLHWVLQVPHTPERPWDLRVGSSNSPESPSIVYAAKPNSALCLLIGTDSSYEIPLIPENAGDRLSIIMTFEAKVDPTH
ncbi:hypothetical protein NG791_04290 [Laspinema sp. D1]|uniref:hypothetical protein n=1 Tax=Laspinema palackyanum TaxID=3231601 RepID=UPI003497E8F1|nr:hypothetical protein [Laspinema sp. D2b]